MSTDTQKNQDDQEIDLSDISKRIGNLFDGINDFIFKCIQFVIRHIIVFTILIIAGVVLGYYLDQVNKNYDHAIVVKPNFGSTDYLYAKVELLNARIQEKDTAYLKSIGIESPSKFSKIKIEPIIDVYQFVNDRNERNFELLKLMAEDSDIKKIVEEKTTSKNYTYHLISLSTKKATTDEKLIKPLLNFLNDSDFYKKIQKEYVNNIHMKMKANDSTIAQIDAFLNSLSNPANTTGSQLVYHSENTQLNDVIQTKEKLVSDQGYRRIELVSLDRIIKESTVVTNIENNKSTNGKMKLILPILFSLIYVLIYLFINFYKSHAIKTKLQQ